MRLWTELNPKDVANRRCPYSGEQISMAMLFSGEVEIEHILPFSMTLDDSLNNKTVALRRANRDKGNRHPFDAFGHSPPGYDFLVLGHESFGRNVRPTVVAARHPLACQQQLAGHSHRHGRLVSV